MSLFPVRISHVRVLLAEVGGALAAAVLIAGCGNNYRPVVTPVNSSGPPAQPTSYAVTVSYPSSTSDGVATIIDYSGDTIMAEASVGSAPIAFTIDNTSADGGTGYTYNSDHTITNFPVSTSLQQKSELVTTLSSCAQPINIDATGMGLWIGDLNIDSSPSNVNCLSKSTGVDIFSGSPQKQINAVPIAPASTPVFIAGAPTAGGQREFVISQNLGLSPTGVECNLTPSAEPPGTAQPIELSNNNLDVPIPLGKCPVFAVQTPDQRRLFVLNRGDDTITVINSQNPSLDSCTPFQNQNNQWVTCHPTIQLPAGSGPVYAEYNVATEQLVVANYDAGTISVINASLDEYGNDSNTYANPTCVAPGSTTSTYAGCGAITGGFGTITATIPVGPNPASVTVLFDGSRAYTANQGDCGSNCTATGNGTVTVVNLSSYTVEKTLPVTGLPRTVVSTENSLYGKVYAAAPNSDFLTIVETETDLIDTTILTEGNILDVRTTSQSGGSQTVTTYSGGSVTINNINYSSRVPGYGQPCNLPPSAMIAQYGANYTLADCQTVPNLP